MILENIINQGPVTLGKEALIELLKTLASKNIKLTPTNASTGSIIQNTGMGAVGGAGVGMILSLLRWVPGPIGWVALATGLIGAGLGFTVTKYHITIADRKDGQFIVTIEG